MKEALFYTHTKNNKVRCELCPWYCELNESQTGNCRVRTNKKGQLITEVFNKVAALGIDPIEKKPLYHFHPAKNILSIGEVGCNLHCHFCQNHRISQCLAKEFSGFHDVSSQTILKEALKTWNNLGLAYTYNEPFTFYEFMQETAELVKAKGLKNVVVSNGYVNPEPLKEALHWIDAFNIDLKAFNDSFYTSYTKGKLAPVLASLKIIAKSKAHLEITNLVIPHLNDDEKEFTELVKWIATELGEHIPLHLSRYFPQYKFSASPTPIEKLESLFVIAKKYLHHVYLGNVSDEKRSSTYCTHCGVLLVNRNGFKTELSKLSTEGNCTVCGSYSNIIV